MARQFIGRGVRSTSNKLMSTPKAEKQPTGKAPNAEAIRQQLAREDRQRFIELGILVPGGK